MQWAAATKWASIVNIWTCTSWRYPDLSWASFLVWPGSCSSSALTSSGFVSRLCCWYSCQWHLSKLCVHWKRSLCRCRKVCMSRWRLHSWLPRRMALNVVNIVSLSLPLLTPAALNLPHVVPAKAFKTLFRLCSFVLIGREYQHIVNNDSKYLRFSGCGDRGTCVVFTSRVYLVNRVAVDLSIENARLFYLNQAYRVSRYSFKTRWWTTWETVLLILKRLVLLSCILKWLPGTLQMFVGH